MSWKKNGLPGIHPSLFDGLQQHSRRAPGSKPEKEIQIEKSKVPASPTILNRLLGYQMILAGQQ